MLAAALMLFAGACNTQGSASGDGISGTIEIDGSSTVFPISEAIAEEFGGSNPDVNVRVGQSGTGGGFEKFCNGETDISDASRAIKEAEADACAKNGVEFIELKIAIDGLSVVTSPSNTAVTCLSLPDLYALAGPESQGFKRWTNAQALAKELGSKTTFPNASFDMSAPGEESGTYDSFVELALEPIAKKRLEAGKIEEDQVKTSRPDYQSSGDDNIIIQGIEGSKSSLGWVGYSYAQEQGDKVKKLQLSKEPGGECIAPTDESISSAQYPLSRYLYIYVNAAKEKASPAIGAFVDYYLGEGIGAVTEVKYVSLAEADLAATKSVWAARTVGTRDGGK